MKIRGLVLSMICVFGGISLVACGEKDSNSTSQQAQNEIVLSSDENSIYRSICGSLSAFKNPSSVTLLWASDPVVIGGRYVRISAQNSFGGNTTSVYQANGGGLKGPIDSDEISSILSHPSASDISISKINQKLKTYKESMGW